MTRPVDFPLGTWGRVQARDRSDVVRVRVDAAGPTGFLLITEEARGTYDVWLESREEVEDALSTFEISWDG